MLLGGHSGEEERKNTRVHEGGTKRKEQSNTRREEWRTAVEERSLTSFIRYIGGGRGRVVLRCCHAAAAAFTTTTTSARTAPLVRVLTVEWSSLHAGSFAVMASQVASFIGVGAIPVKSSGDKESPIPHLKRHRVRGRRGGRREEEASEGYHLV